jgi:hypothetical protein
MVKEFLKGNATPYSARDSYVKRTVGFHSYPKYNSLELRGRIGI